MEVIEFCEEEGLRYQFERKKELREIGSEGKESVDFRIRWCLLIRCRESCYDRTDPHDRWSVTLPPSPTHPSSLFLTHSLFLSFQYHILSFTHDTIVLLLRRFVVMYPEKNKYNFSSIYVKLGESECWTGTLEKITEVINIRYITYLIYLGIG